MSGKAQAPRQRSAEARAGGFDAGTAPRQVFDGEHTDGADPGPEAPRIKLCIDLVGGFEHEGEDVERDRQDSEAIEPAAGPVIGLCRFK